MAVFMISHLVIKRVSFDDVNSSRLSPLLVGDVSGYLIISLDSYC